MEKILSLELPEAARILREASERATWKPQVLEANLLYHGLADEKYENGIKNDDFFLSSGTRSWDITTRDGKNISAGSIPGKESQAYQEIIKETYKVIAEQANKDIQNIERARVFVIPKIHAKSRETALLELEAKQGIKIGKERIEVKDEILEDGTAITIVNGRDSRILENRPEVLKHAERWSNLHDIETIEKFRKSPDMNIMITHIKALSTQKFIEKSPEKLVKMTRTR